MIFGCKLAAPRLKRLDEKRNAEKGLLRHLARGDRVTDGGIVTKTRAESLVSLESCHIFRVFLGSKKMKNVKCSTS